MRGVAADFLEHFAEERRVREAAAHDLAELAAAIDVLPGVVYRDSLVKVTAFAVPHGKWPHAYGYRFDTPDRSIVLSGDTSPSDAVAKACNGCSVLIHEVISDAHLAIRTPDWQAYHRAYHSPAYDVGRVAAKAKPKTSDMTRSSKVSHRPWMIIGR